MKVKKFLKVIVIMIALAFSTNINAITGGGKHHRGGSSYGGGSGSHCQPKGDSVPLDGGLSVLLLGAAAFGIKKLRGNKNE